MRRGGVAALLFAVALVACALAFARLVAAPGASGVELGRARVTGVDERLRERLARGDVDVLVQWFGPSETERPAGYADVEDRVRSAFEALERAAPGRVRTQVLRPDSDPEARRHADALGLAPFRERRVVRDGWTDVPVWSALRTVVAGRGASVVRALTPALASSTQALVAAGLAEIESPRRPRIALSAPPGHVKLRALLGEIAEVSDVDFDEDATLPDDVDLLFWIAPARVEPAHVARLRELVDRGGSAVVAAGGFERGADAAAVVFERAGADLSPLYADLGISAESKPLLEAPPREAADRAADWTWHVVRSIAARQDFRSFGAQPNGTLAFRAPAPLAPDVVRLERTGATFTSLATSSDRCFFLEGDGTRAFPADLAVEHVRIFEPPRTLLARIAPEDPTRGSVVVAASASPFGDLGLADASYVHADLVRVLVGGLASAERRALSAVARARPAPLPEASSAQRWTWRALCIALVPLALIAIGLARGALSLAGLARRTLALALAGVAAVAVVGLVARAIPSSAGADASRGNEHGLAPELVSIAAASTGTTITVAFSEPAALPPEIRPLARELAGRCERLARATPGVAFREVAPDGIGAADVGRIERTDELGDQRTTRSFFASVVVERASASASGEVDRERAHEGAGHATTRRVLDFPDAASFDHADFRIALALRDVTTGERARIAFLSEPARVTPAEALENYQRRGLFAPGTGDPFAAARALLADNGFEVVGLRPDGRVGEDQPTSKRDLFVWMQPRRDATEPSRALASHLQRGGNALVAAQQNRIRPRLRADGGAALWPEPLFPDVDRLLLEHLGVTLASDLVLDAQSGALRTIGTREVDGRLESATMELANPLVVRSTPADRPRSAYTAGVGDLLLPSPARIAFDAAKYGRLSATPILATSTRASTVAWTGGDVAAETLVAPTETADPLTLGLSLEGTFPGPNAIPAIARDEHSILWNEQAKLVLYGASEPFTDAYLRAPGTDHARLLLQTCAALALPPELSSLLARRPSVGGYRAIEPGERLRARLLVLAAGPALVLALALAWRMRRARRLAASIGRTSSTARRAGSA